jgi:hypothetical protein
LKDSNGSVIASEGIPLKKDLISDGNWSGYLLKIEFMGSAVASEGRLCRAELRFAGIETAREILGGGGVG